MVCLPLFNVGDAAGLAPRNCRPLLASDVRAGNCEMSAKPMPNSWLVSSCPANAEMSSRQPGSAIAGRTPAPPRCPGRLQSAPAGSSTSRGSRTLPHEPADGLRRRPRPPPPRDPSSSPGPYVRKHVRRNEAYVIAAQTGGDNSPRRSPCRTEAFPGDSAWFSRRTGPQSALFADSPSHRPSAVARRSGCRAAVARRQQSWAGYHAFSNTSRALASLARRDLIIRKRPLQPPRIVQVPSISDPSSASWPEYITV